MTNHESLLRTWLKLHIPLIDLRSHQQFIKLHLLDSTNIPVSQLSDRGMYSLSTHTLTLSTTLLTLHETSFS
jgi:hypothetical protein